MRRGAQEIMDHPWFSSLNFTELYNKTVSTAKIYTHKATRVPKRYKNCFGIHQSGASYHPGGDLSANQVGALVNF